MVRLILTLPVCLSTPPGAMKMPDPMMLPTMMVQPWMRPSEAFRPTASSSSSIFSIWNPELQRNRSQNCLTLYLLLSFPCVHRLVLGFVRHSWYFQWMLLILGIFKCFVWKWKYYLHLSVDGHETWSGLVLSLAWLLSLHLIIRTQSEMRSATRYPGSSCTFYVYL